MILPTKHEELNKNVLVLGASVLKALKKKSYLNIESLYQEIGKDIYLPLYKFNDTILFLWLNDFIEVNGTQVSLKDVSEKNI